MILPDDLPASIGRILKGFDTDKDDIGRSTASVLRCSRGNDVFYLKTEKTSPQSIRERQCLEYLQGKLPVPELIAFDERDGMSFLLTRALSGEMACSRTNLSDPLMVAEVLADGLMRMWKLDISDCPFEETIDVKLETGRKRAAGGEVDMDALSPENRDMSSPEEILRKLEETRPETEDLVFTHGDYCLPNIYIHNGRLTGLLDLGRAGIADRWQDLALCIWSICYNMRHRDEAETEKMVRTLLDALDLEMNEEKYRYYNLLDELF